MSKITGYLHHGVYVRVDEGQKGKHKEHCLCYRCAIFNPQDKDKNCKIANLNFALCQLCNLVLPVWECPQFIEKEGEHE